MCLSGPDKVQQISLYGAISHCGPGYEHVVQEETSEIHLDQANFEERLDVILEAIERGAQREDERRELPPWEPIEEDADAEPSS